MSSAPRRVLVVDDDDDLRSLVAMKLELSGFAVSEAVDGADALDQIGREQPDLVILDIMMPGVSGLEVCRYIRSDPATASLPVILLTARTRDSDVERGFAAGASDYVAKPFSPRELLTRVNAVMNRGAVRT